MNNISKYIPIMNSNNNSINISDHELERTGHSDINEPHGIDILNLSRWYDQDTRLLQPLWSLALRHSSLTSSPGFPMIVYLVIYVLCQVPCTILDLLSVRFHWIKKYKVQPQADLSWSRHILPAIVTTTWNHLLYILPASVAQVAWTPSTYLPSTAPTLWEFCWHQYISLAIVDCEYYMWHVLHHKNRFLYRHFHSFHHRYMSVNSWVTQYSHPWELFSLGLFTTTAPWILRAHPMTCWCFMAFVLAVSVEDHCGYDLPIMPHHWAPFWGGSRKHDMHHQRPLTNFQPYFNWFDRWFGSEYPGRCYQKGKSKDTGNSDTSSSMSNFDDSDSLDNNCSTNKSPANNIKNNFSDSITRNSASDNFQNKQLLNELNLIRTKSD